MEILAGGRMADLPMKAWSLVTAGLRFCWWHRMTPDDTGWHRMKLDEILQCQDHFAGWRFFSTSEMPNLRWFGEIRIHWLRSKAGDCWSYSNLIQKGHPKIDEESIGKHSLSLFQLDFQCATVFWGCCTQDDFVALGVWTFWEETMQWRSHDLCMEGLRRYMPRDARRMDLFCAKEGVA